MAEQHNLLRAATVLGLLFAATTSGCGGNNRPMVRPDGSALSEEEARALADPDIPDPEWAQDASTDEQRTLMEEGDSKEGGGNPDSTFTPEEQQAIENANTYGVLYAADGTPFSVVPDPANRGRQCAQISGHFQDTPGARQDAGRLAQALGNGSVDFYVSTWADPLTIDTDTDPFPSQVHVVHIGDKACKNPTAVVPVDPSDY